MLAEIPNFVLPASTSSPVLSIGSGSKYKTLAMAEDSSERTDHFFGAFSMEEYILSLNFLKDVLVAATVLTISLDIYGVRRLKALGERLIGIDLEDRNYRAAMDQYKVEMARWKIVCDEMQRSLLHDFKKKEPALWEEKQQLEAFIAEVGPRAKSVEQADFVDYSRWPFPELFAKEGRLADIEYRMGKPDFPDPPTKPKKSQLGRGEVYVSAVVFLSLATAAIIITGRVSDDEWEKWRGNFFVMLIITLSEVLTPLIVIYPLARLAIALSTKMAQFTGFSALGISIAITKVAQSMVLLWTLRIFALIEIAWNIGDRLLLL